MALFGVLKSQEFVQTSAAAPTARPANGFAFNAAVLATAPQVVTNATVKPSNSTPLRTLVPLDTNSLLSWRFEEKFNTKSALDAAYPDGNILSPVRYTNTLFTVNDGRKSVVVDYSLLSFAGNPSTPQITNFAAAQSIDQTRAFTLRFNSSGSTLLDLVQLVVMDSASNLLFSSPAPFGEGALTGSSNAVTIPPYTLPAGSNLVGHLTFVRPVDLETNAYVGASGIAAVVRDTEFPIVTRPAAQPPQLQLAASGSVLAGRFSGESNRLYRLQGSTNLIDWLDLLVTNAATGVFGESNLASRRFYRVKVGE